MSWMRVPIDGMTCTSCVSHVTKAVRRVEGVVQVKVDLGSDAATIGFDPGRTSLTEIGRAIRKSGYEPRVDEARTVSATTPHGGVLARLFSRSAPSS